MTRTERQWRDGQREGTGQPQGIGPDESAGPGRPVPSADPLAGPGPEDAPLVERAGEGVPLVERAGEGVPLVERAGEGVPLVERAGEGVPLVEEVPAPAGLASSADDQERFVARWQEIQAGFVDEPRRAVQDADALVVDMMDRLARMLASEREQLESLGETGKVSTEDLRQGLRRYRTLFERLLAV
jgi:hypothetical protein